MKRIITALLITLTFSMFLANKTSNALKVSGKKTAPPSIRLAIEKSVPLLESIRLPFIEKTGCVSCHHNSIAAMAIMMAGERGFKVNKQIIHDESEQILDIWNLGREKMLQGDGFGGQQITAGYILLGLSANNQPPNKTTDAIVYYLIGRQAENGRWTKVGNRPPSGGSDISTTAIALRALQIYAPKGLRREVNTRIVLARTWLVNAPPRNNEDQTFQLLGSSWANTDKNMLQKMVKDLLANQHEDGGWGQYTTMPSDAYATGQALVALHQAGGLAITHAAYQRGVSYLLSNQAADGSWLVQTRSFPFQKYFESGFPYGHNQWISASATSWATMALTLTIEAPGSVIKRASR